jgi:hypothetical protein
MTIPEYLMQIRIAADTANDDRSLVAIAAQFERDAADYTMPTYLRRSITKKAHIRNQS